MFKLKFSDTQSRQFLTAYRKVMQFTGFKDSTITYNATKIGRKFDQEAQICQETFIKLAKNFAKLDEKGNFVLQEKENINAKGEKVVTKIPNTFVTREECLADGSWEKALKEWNAMEFEIQCHKIKLADLNGAGLSPEDLLALDALLDVEPPAKAAGAVTSIKPGATATPAAPH